jgi:tetrahydrodipicolinate N-succinyltransferase
MNTKHNFYDGRGEVPAHQHLNGGGWVDDTASVHPTADIGKGADIGEGADIG